MARAWQEGCGAAIGRIGREETKPGGCRIRGCSARRVRDFFLQSAARPGHAGDSFARPARCATADRIMACTWHCAHLGSLAALVICAKSN